MTNSSAWENTPPRGTPFPSVAFLMLAAMGDNNEALTRILPAFVPCP